MDPKQEKQLQILLKARNRANKILAKQHKAREDAEKQRIHYLENWQSLRDHGKLLLDISRECGLYTLMEAAAKDHGGKLIKEVNYFVDYGPGARYLAQTKEFQNIFVYRTTYLALIIQWEEAGLLKELEVRVRRNGLVTFHNSRFPVFRFMWVKNPDILRRKLENALLRPRNLRLPVTVEK